MRHTPRPGGAVLHSCALSKLMLPLVPVFPRSVSSSDAVILMAAIRRYALDFTYSSPSYSTNLPLHR